MVDRSNADEVKDLLPPEIHKHFKNGDYMNKLVEFPNTRWAWDDGFEEATKWNAEHLVLDEHKSPIDKATGKRPEYIRGLHFPTIDPNDPDAGYKALWNLDYAYYTGGNSHNWTLLNWVSRSGIDRSSVQDVYFLYYDGFFFDGKPEDFEWKVVGHKEGLRFVDPDSIAGKVKERELPGGGWRTIAINNDRTVGYMVKDWKGVPWGPVAAAVAKRKFWVLEGVPKDKYYLYGKMELWIDDTTWAGAWNRKFSWRGDLLNTLQVLGYATFPFNEHERWWGATMAFQLAENIKQDRATAAGMNGPGTDPPSDRRVPLDPGFFDYQTLSRFGK